MVASNKTGHETLPDTHPTADDRAPAHALDPTNADGYHFNYGLTLVGGVFGAGSLSVSLYGEVGR
jgi:hypothetical protein